MKLDPATMIFMSTLMAAGMAPMLFVMRRSFPSEIRGLEYWAAGMVTLIVSTVLFALRGMLADVILLPLANSVMLWGSGLLVVGTRLFYGRAPGWPLFHMVWLLGLGCMARWLLYDPDFAVRVACFSFLTLVLNGAMLAVVVRHGEAHLSSWFFAALMLLQAAVMLHRGLSALHGDAGVDMYHGGIYNAWYLAIINLMTLLMPVGFMTVATRRLRLVLEDRANRDPLTQAYNRRGFAAAYERHVQQRQSTLALLAVDLDHFKAVNDTHGHAAGDRVLVHVATIIGETLGDDGLVARFGGEEFVVLLPGATQGQALRIAACIRAALLVPDGAPADRAIPVCTVSIGVACREHPGESMDALLARADGALYLAKQNGRDRAELAAGLAAGAAWQHGDVIGIISDGRRGGSRLESSG